MATLFNRSPFPTRRPAIGAAETLSGSGLSRSVIATLLVLGLLGTALLLTGRRDYPDLHAILDTGIFLLSCTLALLLWGMGTRIDRALLRWLAISFAVTSLLELVHVAMSVEWSRDLVITREREALRPTTWALSAYVLPIGVALSVLLTLRRERRGLGLVLGLLALSVALLPVFNGLPRYVPAWLGITRPTLLLVPLLWAAIAVYCWRQRSAERVLPMLVSMAVVLLVAHIPMLNSDAPNDAQAMVAHLGKIAGYLSLLLALLQMASADMRQLIRTQSDLARLNAELEQRVRDRTAEFESTNASLQAEIRVRLQAQSALRDSQQLLQAVSDNSTAVLYVKDLRGRYLMVNRRYCELFHLSEGSVLGRTDYDIFPKPAADAFRAMDDRVAAAGHALTEEESAPQDDGQHTYISVKSVLRDDSGKPYAVFGISTDITDLKRAEQRTRAQLARLSLLHRIARAIGERQDLRSILHVVVHSLEDHLPLDFACACLYDPAQRQLTVSSLGPRSSALAPALAMTEQARIDIEGSGLPAFEQCQLMYEPDTAALALPVPRRLSGAGLHSLVAVPLMAEGKVFGVLLAARRQVDGFSSGDCEFLRQLSDHVGLAAHQAQLYGSLQQAYEDLRQTQSAVQQQDRLRVLGQLASGVAHDINNAISPAALYAETLLEREPALSERARSYLATIRRAIGDVAQTVNRMRLFSRQHESQASFVRIDLNQLVEQVIDLTCVRWRDVPQERGIVITVERELSADLPPVLGEEGEIRDTLTNLVFNAVDAMPDGGTLKFRTRAVAAGRGVCLEVTDTGIGMDEATRQRCLEPFFTTKGERGTGLGLAMVYGMTQRHDAEIEIDSVPASGTTMRLIFPAATRGADSPSKPAAAVGPQQPLRILIVDDDPLILESMRAVLESDGHIVTAADGGQAGIEAFCAAARGSERFAVVITDLGMPHVDGRKVAAAIKESAPSTRVILLTGWGQRLQAQNELPPHVDRVLNKPPKMGDLRSALSEISV